MQRQRGFTLIEMIVTLALLATLAAAADGSYASAAAGDAVT